MSDTTASARMVWVGRLVPWVTESLIKNQLFRGFDLETTSLLTHIDQPASYVFVTLVSRAQAQRAIFELNGKRFHGRNVLVQTTRPRVQYPTAVPQPRLPEVQGPSGWQSMRGSGPQSGWSTRQPALHPHITYQHNATPHLHTAANLPWQPLQRMPSHHIAPHSYSSMNTAPLSFRGPTGQTQFSTPSQSRKYSHNKLAAGPTSRQAIQGIRKEQDAETHLQSPSKAAAL